MSNMLTGFRADLRYPIEDKDNPGDKWSQWSSLPMIQMSALDAYQFVKAMIHNPEQKILEIGCGNGYLALELARDGHEVIGLDKSQEIIEVAERTSEASPDTPGFGKLTYLCADFGTWQGADASFDLVVINRTLHHLTDLGPTLTKIKRLLTQQGRIICQDYAFDRLNDQTATWMYSMQRLLFLSGLSEEDPATMIDDAQSIEALRKAWFKRSEDHHLNRHEEMSLGLSTMFREQFFAWVPYLYVYVGNRISHATPEQERALIPYLRSMEQYLTEKGYMQAVGFRYVGSL
jgi:ubiquinone/menaquinone biosynthesis C-methylase UbiE